MERSEPTNLMVAQLLAFFWVAEKGEVTQQPPRYIICYDLGRPGAMVGESNKRQRFLAVPDWATYLPYTRCTLFWFALRFAVPTEAAAPPAALQAALAFLFRPRTLSLPIPRPLDFRVCTPLLLMAVFEVGLRQRL